MPYTTCTPGSCTAHQHAFLTPLPLYSNRLPHLPHIPASLDHNLHTCSPHAYTHACTHTSTCLCPSIPRYPMPYTLRTPELTHHTYTSITVVPPCLPHSETACTQDYHMVAHAPMPLPIDVISCHAPQAHTKTCTATYTCLPHGSSAHRSSTYSSNAHGTSSAHLKGYGHGSSLYSSSVHGSSVHASEHPAAPAMGIISTPANDHHDSSRHGVGAVHGRAALARLKHELIVTFSP